MKNTKVQPKNLVNDDIKHAYDECMLIDENGTNQGVMSVDAALDRAADAGLDLVLVGKGQDVPTCIITNWSKELYRKQKAARANKKNAQKDTKQMKLRTQIGDNDIAHKMKLVNGFLDDGHKCILTVMLKGRELSHPEIAEELIERAVKLSDGHGVITSKPHMNGHDMSVTLSPVTKR